MQTKPREVIFQRNGLSKEILNLFKRRLNNPLLTIRNPEEFWDISKTFFELETYFLDVKKETEVPESLVRFLKDQEIAKAFGGLISYLRELKLDVELLKMRNFSSLEAIHSNSSLVLDGQTLFNLEILENNSDFTEKGTLLSFLNFASTPFGKRLFKKWLCHPLIKKSEIEERLDAVDDLKQNQDLSHLISTTFLKLPDLERMVSRIYASACSLRDFLIVLENFEKVNQLFAKLNQHSSQFQSKILLNMLLDGFPDLQHELDGFKQRSFYFSSLFIYLQSILGLTSKKLKKKGS